MKIGFIGNVNNYPFPVALAMKEQGADVRFVIDSSESLHRPEFRFERSDIGYGDWIFDLSPLRVRHLIMPSLKKRRLRALMEDRDAVVVNGIGIAFSTMISKPSFVIVAGSDLDVMAASDSRTQVGVKQSGGLTSLATTWFYRRMVRMQRMGFREACGVDYPLPGMLPHGDKLLNELGIGPDRRYGLMPTDLDWIPVSPLPVNPVLRILCSARLCWREPLPPGFGVLDNKRNDILIKGVALFRKNNSLPLQLRLPKKGLHLEETRALVTQLGLDEIVVWLDEMSQADFSREMIAADIIADHFGEGSIGMAAREAMAMGRPLLAHAKSEIFERHLGERLPIADARTPEQVANAIQLLSDRQVRQEYATEARAFAERHFSARKAAEVILSVLEQR